MSTVGLVGNTASFTTSALTAGGHSIAVVYSGNTNFAGSNSALQQTVHKHDTSVALTSGPASTVFGESVSFTATVSSTGPNTPTGNVTFKDGSSSLGTAALDNNGVASFTTSAPVDSRPSEKRTKELAR